MIAKYITYRKGVFSYGSIVDPSPVQISEILNEPQYILHNIPYEGNKSGKYITQVFNRVTIMSRGGEWKGEWCIYETDSENVHTYIFADGFYYHSWRNEWQNAPLHTEDFLCYLNKMEEYGVDRVFYDYEVRMRDEYERLKDVDSFLKTCEHYIKSDKSSDLQKSIRNHIDKISLQSDRLTSLERRRMIKS